MSWSSCLTAPPIINICTVPDKRFNILLTIQNTGLNCPEIRCKTNIDHCTSDTAWSNLNEETSFHKIPRCHVTFVHTRRSAADVCPPNFIEKRCVYGVFTHLRGGLVALLRSLIAAIYNTGVDMRWRRTLTFKQGGGWNANIQ